MPAPMIPEPERVRVVVDNGAMRVFAESFSGTDTSAIAEATLARGERMRIVREELAKLVEGLRENCHATFNGGWHGNADGMRAFHHGMDTVCNVLDDKLSALGAASEEKTG